MKNMMLLGALLLVAGCVSPGPIDQTELIRYQQALADRGPQEREDCKPGGLLRPVPKVTGPAFKIRTDSATGKKFINLTLKDAVMKALANSTDIRVAAYDPAIAREEMIKAAADFDYIVFGQTKFANNKAESGSIFALPGTININETLSTQFGVRKHFTTGADVALSYTFNRVWDSSLAANRQTNYQPATLLQINQPLLRDAWPDFNLAKLRIARINAQINDAAFRQKVEATINDVIDSYWSLVRARREVDIQQLLLDATVITRKKVIDREPIDATKAEVSQARAAVALRQAQLLQAQKAMLDTQDRLNRLLSDSQINMEGRLEIVPITMPSDSALKLDAAEQLVTALTYNSRLEQARLGIAAAEIAVSTAKNQTLPKLDFQATAQTQGFNTSGGRAHEQMFKDDLFMWSAALVYEYPIGNRAARADLQRRYFEKSRAISTLQNTADQIAFDINERIRQINTAYGLVVANRQASVALADQLDALSAVEDIRGRLSPEFLQVKLQAQEQLALAERSVIASIIDYNTALADLDRSTGTLLTKYNIEVAMPVTVGEGNWPSMQDEPTSTPTSGPIRPITGPNRLPDLKNAAPPPVPSETGPMPVIRRDEVLPGLPSQKP